ncbi:VOC family protein [Saccharothrix sp.]|uniref:VOC family protein n=1 Tax=Saccharothrix sp. TaxID=1873460 RepID=UPI002810AE11|nr:VOC family protein [Saccharothrix sp.]
MIELTATVLDAPDPSALARFHSDLLGWPVTSDEPGWATSRPPDGTRGRRPRQATDPHHPAVPRTPHRLQTAVPLTARVMDSSTPGNRCSISSRRNSCVR